MLFLLVIEFSLKINLKIRLFSTAKKTFILPKMDRRLLLHQKLQASKQKKITIKEGDRLVTLNLKKDIIDPNIEIADKVLFMLEAFAEKIPNKVSETNNQPADTSATTTSPVVAAPSTETSPLSTKLISNIKSRDKVHVSPSKRVRFDFDKTSDDESISLYRIFLSTDCFYAL